MNRWIYRTGLLLLLPAAISLGCRDAAEPQPSSATVDADMLLRQMIATYQSADSYQDRGIVRLSYRAGETKFVDEAKLGVKFRRSGELQLRAYQLTMTCDDGVARSLIADETTNDMDGQIAVRRVPQPLTLDAVYEDPVVLSVVAGGMGGPPVTLEMLVANQPCQDLLRAQVPRRLLRPDTIGGRTCDRVRVELPEGPLVFWIDRENHLLHRLEYPTNRLMPEVESDVELSDLSLVAEFRDARLNAAIPASEFELHPPESAKLVHRFVLPPQPLNSPLVGQRPDDYFFTDLAGKPLASEDLAGRTTVLVWFNNHPASATALQQLQQTVAAGSSGGQLEIVAVCTEPSHVANADLRAVAERWQITLPIVRDLEAYGRDVFEIPWAPTTVVLDSKGVVQHFEVGSSPQLAETIANVTSRLARGEDVAAETLQRYRDRMREYQAKLDAAAQSAAQQAGKPRHVR